MNDFKQFINTKVEEEFEYARSLRRYFHEHPELSRVEFNTANKIEEELHKLGLETKRVGNTGVYAEIIGTKNDGINKDIILRADIDALPIQEKRDIEYKSKNDGVMHACGHDGHTASLLTAAKILSNNKDQFSGKVRLCFQPGEEVGFGAKEFVKGDLLDGASRSFAFHCWPYLNCGKVAIVPGPNNASVDLFKIKIKGHSAHISVPELGADAVHTISNIVVELQKLNNKVENPIDRVLVGIGKVNGGVAFNVIAEDASCEGTIRVFTPELRKDTIEKIINICETVSSKYGCKAEIDWDDCGSALINDLESSLEAQKVAREIFGEENVIIDKKPTLIGDDMADFINKVPGVYAFVGTGNDSRKETQVALHDSCFDIDENALKVSVSLTVGYAIRYLNDQID